MITSVTAFLSAWFISFSAELASSYVVQYLEVRRTIREAKLDDDVA